MVESDLSLSPSHARQGNVEVGPFRCYLQLSNTRLEVEVLHKTTSLGHCSISVQTDSESAAPDYDWN